jgi:hypothetical protein
MPKIRQNIATIEWKTHGRIQILIFQYVGHWKPEWQDKQLLVYITDETATFDDKQQCNSKLIRI